DVATTLQVAAELRQCALTHYRDELHRLKRRLTFPGMAQELYRIETQLTEYEHPQQLLEELEKIHDRVLQKHQGLFLDYVERFQLAVRTFGFHFATLDLRQDSSVHEEVVGGLLRKLWPDAGAAYADLS